MCVDAVEVGFLIFGKFPLLLRVTGMRIWPWAMGSHLNTPSFRRTNPQGGWLRPQKGTPEVVH